MQPRQDRIDKDNPQYTFIPEIEHTTQQIEANNKLAEILNPHSAPLAVTQVNYGNNKEK
ncbi:hypothetical protein [Nodularia chucula]|uniref:hypothetical protein n=1 Tax=Nodularia chucula TaxID=3093667 RepID=UPI0039C5F6D7